MNSRSTSVILGVFVVTFFITTVLFLSSTIYFYRLSRQLSAITPGVIDSRIYDKSIAPEVQCNTQQDNVCPSWCAPGSDFDCCVKSGKNWISGRGCYDK